MTKKIVSYKIRTLSFVLSTMLFLTANTVHAQGPNSPEAAAFEPVDATDMVNLVTGNMSYVLPLLNVPSPEGGYPIALSYHSGIAVDQEASWVGLGWNINPGSINRAVNGYPDDWGETNFNEFFYDEGWEEDYYSFSAGVSISDGISVGLGLSWGSNQSLGGYVSANIGIGDNAGIGGSIGTNGARINGRLNGFSASLSTSGVGVNYGFGNTGLGVGLNYSYSSGFSANASASKGIGYNNSSLSVGMSSSGVFATGSVNSIGAGISNSTQSVDSGDYNRALSGISLNLNVFSFFVSYSHLNIKYSLFKVNSLFTSGMLYPVKTNTLELEDNMNYVSKMMNENHFMDINIIHPFRQNDTYNNLIDDERKNDRNNLLLPNYDNYIVNAQGLSGSINPYLDFELNLSGRGRGEQNLDNEYLSYLNYSFEEYDAPVSSGGLGGLATSKKYFSFSSAYNSFLRIEKDNIPLIIDIPDDNVNDFTVLNAFNYSDTNNFQNTNSLNGHKKREGNHIETFTNKEIRNEVLHGFVEAREGTATLNRNDTTIFLDDGIGAYKITTLDGKTYHYSLPVYQFESTYKNFKNEDYNEQDNENVNFLEIYKDSPYATHWLLTAITGPDYYDKNENGSVDEDDYGYWVEFDYGKWSDGYIWQTPNGRYEETEDKDDPTKKTYSYAWGRKQIYYLDAIKTRTHTALFIKELRNDSKGISKIYNQTLESARRAVLKPGDKIFGVSYLEENSSLWEELEASMDDFNLENNSWWTIPEVVNGIPGVEPRQKVFYVEGRKVKVSNFNMPENHLLKLRKILLIKNNNLPAIPVGNGFGLTSNGSISNYFRIGDKIGSRINFEMAINNNGESHRWGIDTYLYFKDPSTHLKEFSIHQHQNVLDVKDIEGLNLEEQATEVIDFEHDYSLANNTPNAETGRLTLKSINFKGRSGVQMIPPYKFDYEATSTNYNEDDIDAWGYHKTNPSIWSLNKITMPTGGKIKINYGKDIYGAEAAISEEIEFPNVASMTTSGSKVKFTFASGSPLISTHFYINSYYRISYDVTEYEEDPYGDFYTVRTNEEAIHKVSAIGSNWVEFDVESTNTDFHYASSSENCANVSYQTSCIEDFIVYGKVYDFSNLVEGGGIVTNSITINDGVKDIATTEYIYNRGITSYAPSEEPKGVPYVSELPAPMVLYGEVTMNTKDGNNNYLGSTVYEFETLEPRKEENGYIFSLGKAFRVKENQNAFFEAGKVITNKFTIESKLGNIGRIKSVRSYNSDSQLLNKTENFYKEDLEADGEIGVTQESHKSYKRLRKNDVETFYVSSTSKINYPSVLEKTTTSQGSFSVDQYYDKYDFLTGQVLETRTYASDGVAFKSKIVPAYTIPEYNPTSGYGMGSKIDNSTNKNMLTQSAANYTYLLDEENDLESIISVGVTTWNNEWSYIRYDGNNDPINSDAEKVWRKYKSFVWKGDINDEGIYTNFTGEDDNFNWGVGAIQSSTSSWQKASETTKYNRFSLPLESKDINGNYASTKMGDKNAKVLAVSNAAYVDMYYSGAEYRIEENDGYFDGEIKSTGYTPSTTAHTGNYVVQVTQGGNAFEVQVPNRPERNTPRKQRFKVSVWIKTSQKDNAQIKVGSSVKSFNTNETQTAGDWTLLNGYIDIPSMGTTVTITSTNGSIQLDDFRLHPITSSMTSYVYNEFDEVTFITGANGLSTCYVYDAAGRLKQTWGEILDNPEAGITGGFKLINENNYHYNN